MLIVADKQILCATCGKLVGLLVSEYSTSDQHITVKDHLVIVLSAEQVFYCNSTCKERAQV